MLFIKSLFKVTINLTKAAVAVTSVIISKSFNLYHIMATDARIAIDKAEKKRSAKRLDL